jgi:hypothetical protein
MTSTSTSTVRATGFAQLDVPASPLWEWGII